MKKTENLIGQKIAFDQTGLASASAHLNANVISKLQMTIQCYNDLQILKPFSEAVFKEWIETDGRSVYEEYMTLAKKDAKKFTLPALQEAALKHGEEAPKPFMEAWNDAVRGLTFNSALYAVSFDWSAIRLNEDLQPVVDLDVVEEYFTLRIETESQAALWEIGKRAESVLNELHQLCFENNVDFSKIYWTGESGKAGIFDYSNDGRLKLNTDAVKLV